VPSSLSLFTYVNDYVKLYITVSNARFGSLLTAIAVFDASTKQKPDLCRVIVENNFDVGDALIYSPGISNPDARRFRQTVRPVI
jgi:hypothetical protein